MEPITEPVIPFMGQLTQSGKKGYRQRKPPAELNITIKNEYAYLSRSKPLSLLETRFLYAAIQLTQRVQGNVQKAWDSEIPVKVTYKKFCEVFEMPYKNLGGQRFQEIINTARQINALEITVLHNRRWTAFPFFVSFSVDDITRQVSFEINRRFFHLFSGLLSEYYTIKPTEMMPLRSAYSVQIYNILCTKLHQQELALILELKQLYEILGIGDDTYKQYGHFKARVLEIARCEIEASHSARCYFEYEEIKQGKRVHSILFKIFNRRGGLLK